MNKSDCCEAKLKNLYKYKEKQHYFCGKCGIACKSKPQEQIMECPRKKAFGFCKIIGCGYCDESCKPQEQKHKEIAEKIEKNFGNALRALGDEQSEESWILEFKELVKTTDKVFDIKEVSADKAYLSRENLEAVHNLGGVAYIPFKSNTKGRPKGPWIWRKMFDMYSRHREEFMMHYHKRSNSETCFHMIKMKFGSNVRTKNETSQNNEILAKCLAHNLCVLAQEAVELDIDIDFKKCAEIPIAH